MCQNWGGEGEGVEKHCILSLFRILILSNVPLNASLNILLNYLTFMNHLIVE